MPCKDIRPDVIKNWDAAFSGSYQYNIKNS